MNVSQRTEIQSMKLQLLHFTILDRPAVLHHDPEYVNGQRIFSSDTGGGAGIRPFKSTTEHVGSKRVKWIHASACLAFVACIWRESIQSDISASIDAEDQLFIIVISCSTP